MKTYFFIFLFLCAVFNQTFAAHDDTFAQMSSLQGGSTIEKTQIQTQNMSWKYKAALKIAKQKMAKAERKAKQGGFAGGLIAVIVIGALLIPIGILILLPLLMVGVLLLTLGILGTVFQGISNIFF